MRQGYFRSVPLLHYAVALVQLQEQALLQMATQGEADKVSAYFHLLSESAELPPGRYEALQRKAEKLHSPRPGLDTCTRQVRKLEGKVTCAGVAARHEQVRRQAGSPAPALTPRCGEQVRAAQQAEAEVDSLSKLTQFRREQIESLRAEFRCDLHGDTDP